MQRYFIYFRYDGTNYHGWQAQPNYTTVQSVMQNAASVLLRQPVNLIAAGRTDTGVHARMMVAHFDFPHEIDAEQLTYKLNRMLPGDISIIRTVPVSSDMHARFSPKSRTYCYYIHLQKNPFVKLYSCELHFDLDFQAMNEAANHLLKVKDFSTFCKTGSDTKTTFCHVTTAKWIQDSPDSWHFVITADRFLRNMVRAIVGTLLEVGRHRMTIERFDAAIASQKRTEAGESVPANGLFLENITY